MKINASVFARSLICEKVDYLLKEKIAKAAKEKEDASGTWKHPVVTEITAASTFYSAEAYHQKYLQKRGMGSCHI